MSTPLVSRQERYLRLEVGRPEGGANEKQREKKEPCHHPHLLGDLKDSPCHPGKVTIKEQPQILMAQNNSDLFLSHVNVHCTLAGGLAQHLCP